MAQSIADCAVWQIPYSIRKESLRSMKKRLIAKCMAGVLFFTMLLPCVGYADKFPILIEGENYSLSNHGTKNSTASNEFSGGKLALMYCQPTLIPKDGEGYILKYNVKIPAEGYYYIDVKGSKMNISTLSPYQMKINDGDYFDVTLNNSVLLEDNSDTTVYKNILSTYRINPVYLKKGVNSIYFRVVTPRKSDGYLYFFLDCFKISPAEVEIQGITTNVMNNIFEEKDDVELFLNLSASDGNQHIAHCVITDYFGNDIYNGQIVFEKFEKSKKIEFKNKPSIGHYTIKIKFDDKEEVIEDYFSVVMNLSDRKTTTDSRYMVDVAGHMHIVQDKHEGYVRALQLCGIDYVRERSKYLWFVKNGELDFSRIDPYMENYDKYGIKVMQETGSTLPTAPPLGSEKIPYDLAEAYKYANTIAKRYPNSVYEFWNEPELDGNTKSFESPDRFAAYYKASAIGALDASDNLEIVLSGLASTNYPYLEQLCENDLQDYYHSLAFHAHRGMGDADEKILLLPPPVYERVKQADLYGLNENPIYLNEAGMYTTLPDGKEKRENEQKLQARFCVTSTVQTAALDVDYHTWFLWPYYNENGGKASWGCFTKTHTPYSVVNVLSNLTHQLAAAEYAGKFNNMPESAEAHTYKEGNESVAVLWSNKEDTEYTLETDAKNATIIDIMGNSKTVVCENGEIKLTLSPDAQYVRVNGNFKNVDEVSFEKKTKKQINLTKAQRVIINQQLPTNPKDQVKKEGYKVDPKEKTAVTVDVYNLNDTIMSGEIKGIAHGGWKLANDKVNVSIEPFGSQTLTFELTGENIPIGVKSPLVFIGTFDGESTSKSLSYIQTVEKNTEKVSVPVTNFNVAERYIRNVPGRDTVLDITGDNNGIEFYYHPLNKEGWAYPWFDLDETTNFANTNGLMFDVYFEEDPIDINMKCFAIENHGAAFLWQGYDVKKGWNTVIMPWSEFTSSSIGTFDDNFMLDSDIISRIGIGFNTKENFDVKFRIENVGAYKSSAAKSNVDVSDFNAYYDKNNGEIKISGTLVKGVVDYLPETIKVLVDDTVVQSALNGDVLSASGKFEETNKVHTVKIRIGEIYGKFNEFTWQVEF